jgi:hypothetical protein
MMTTVSFVVPTQCLQYDRIELFIIVSLASIRPYITRQDTHALFERSLLTLPVEKSKIIWDKFGDYVTNYSDLASMKSLDQRRAEKYPDGES